MSQAIFVPGRVLNNNIPLGHELVKGYGRKGISPRCMVKIDMQKAYDSLEWGFLEKVLTELNIPEKFPSWIMTCVTTVSYSIVIMASQQLHSMPKEESDKGIYCRHIFLSWPWNT
ncbi:uncharacterized protein [Nicotiana tomentosiformis]|uniref:uncharacterized protein n=1 Tax=Nicotiana tomentosiformis TaxID=4098 RepID=UPI00388C8DB1